MSEPTDHEPDEPTPDELTPDQDAAVRRALAEAGDAGPMPAEVADRLDGVIAGLAAERAAVPSVSHPEDHHVVPLDAAARRRRVRARLLLAAAAVVIVGAIGAGLVSDHGGGADLSAADEMARDNPDRSASLDARTAPSGEAGGEAADSSAPPAAAPSTSREVVPDLQRVVMDGPLREVRADHLSEDLVALQQLTLIDPRAVDYSGTTLAAPEGFMCEPSTFGAGYLIGVEYAGKPAVVAFREPVGQTQAADVLACGTGDVLHSTTLKTTG